MIEQRPIIYIKVREREYHDEVIMSYNEHGTQKCKIDHLWVFRVAVGAYFFHRSRYSALRNSPSPHPRPHACLTKYHAPARAKSQDAFDTGDLLLLSWKMLSPASPPLRTEYQQHFLYVSFGRNSRLPFSWERKETVASVHPENPITLITLVETIHSPVTLKGENQKAYPMLPQVNGVLAK